MQEFLCSTEVVESDADEIISLASSLAVRGNDTETARRSFNWVRDNVTHSFDADVNIVTCSATDTLRARTGICYAKTHLLAALLRANHIPAGFGYQRISLDSCGSKFCLHGFNFVFLGDYGWYAIDPRGNRDYVSTKFDPPSVYLAFETKLPGERTYDTIFPNPLPSVIESLASHSNVASLRTGLPDWIVE